MEITLRELVTSIHGMLFGGFFLMALFGALVLLLDWNNPDRIAGDVSPERPAPRWQTIYLVAMVAAGWAAVLSGAYMIYPWYRAVPPAGVTDLAEFPRRLLLSNNKTSEWHNVGMEWKEHVAWLAPIAITMVAYVISKYGRFITQHPKMRAAVLTFAIAAFAATGVAGAFGAFLNKYAPVRGGDTIILMKGEQ